MCVIMIVNYKALSNMRFERGVYWTLFVIYLKTVVNLNEKQ